MRRYGAAIVLAIALGGLSAAAASASVRSPEISFYFGLERPESRARAALEAVADPGSASYRRFLTVRQAARRYGATRRTAMRLRRAARRPRSGR